MYYAYVIFRYMRASITGRFLAETMDVILISFFTIVNADLSGLFNNSHSAHVALNRLLIASQQGLVPEDLLTEVPFHYFGS